MIGGENPMSRLTKVFLWTAIGIALAIMAFSALTLWVGMNQPQ